VLRAGSGQLDLRPLGRDQGRGEYRLHAHDSVPFRHDFHCQGRAQPTEGYGLLNLPVFDIETNVLVQTLARHIMGVHMNARHVEEETADGEMSLNFIKKYIHYCR